MSHLRGIRAQRRTVARNGAELDFGPWPMPDEVRDFEDTDQVDSFAGVLQPEPVELYTLANPKEQQS